jgi:hypothetical protein
MLIGLTALAAAVAAVAAFVSRACCEDDCGSLQSGKHMCSERNRRWMDFVCQGYTTVAGAKSYMRWDCCMRGIFGMHRCCCM